MQPYNAVDPILDPLWILHEFSRIDRHQTLSVMVTDSDTAGAGVDRRTESGAFVPAPDIV